MNKLKGKNRQQFVWMIYTSIMFIVYPLAMTNGYRNITLTKYAIFGFIVIVFYFYSVWLNFVNEVELEKGIPKGIIRKLWNESVVVDKLLVLFIVANFLAFIFSNYKQVAFSGSTDSHIGFFYVLILGMAYGTFRINISGVEKSTETITMLIAVGADLSVLFALIQFFGGDLFGLLGKMNVDDINNYLSTFGNTGMFGSYMILVIPVISCGFILAKDIRMKLFFGISCVLATISILIANVDAAYLGGGIIIMILLFYLLRNSEYAKREIEYILLNALGAVLFKTLYSICKDARALSVISKKLVNTSYVYWLLFMVVLSILWLTFNAVKSNIFYKAIQITVRVVIGVGTVFVVALFLYFSIIDRNSELGTLGNYLRFTKEWGTQRGYVWTWLWTIFSESSLVHKLFGWGQGSVILLLLRDYLDEMYNNLEFVFDNAHNVYLHLLITTGLFGVFSYIGIIVAVLYSNLKRFFSDKIDYSFGFLVAVFAYAVQDGVSVLQPMTFSLLFVYLGIIKNMHNN